MKKFLKDNIIVWAFALCFLFVELISVCFADGYPFLTKPYYVLSLILIFSTIMLLCRNKIAQCVIGALVLLFQSVLAVGMVFLYFSNGTYFEWSMLNQRSDAAGALQKLDLNVWLILICVGVLSIFMTVSILCILKNPERKMLKGLSKEEKSKLKKELRQKRKQSFSVRAKAIFYTLTSVFLCGAILTAVLVPYTDGLRLSHEHYVERLEGSQYNVYQQYGITGNAVYQMVSGSLANSVDTAHLEEVEPFVYGDLAEENKTQTSKYFGVSEGNNLVYILVESFEWYAWLNDRYDDLTLRTLFPNLYRFMGESIVLENFYAREKTDTSEMLSLVGSNPTGKYINYGFENNALSWALPNVLKNETSSANNFTTVNSFHHNYGTFYNRKALHKSLGFDYFYSIEDMEKYGVTGTVSKGEWCKDEWTLDSLAFDKMRDKMFPALEDGEQFMTYAITFVMHGLYVERENLKNGYNGENYYATMDKYGVYPKSKNEMANYERNYVAAVMDFDRAVGIMLDTLEEKNLLDDTTIVMFADHNTYYNNLAYYAKGIDEKFNSELYRIPCMIYDHKLSTKMEEQGDEPRVSKFTTTADLIPTILDLFGIRSWKNLYFGTSVFVPDVESIIYSRAYGIFVTDKLICYSPSRLLYSCKGFTDEDKEDFIRRAEVHLTKLEYLDKIFYSDYFKTHAFVYA